MWISIYATLVLNSLCLYMSQAQIGDPCYLVHTYQSPESELQYLGIPRAESYDLEIPQQCLSGDVNWPNAVGYLLLYTYRDNGGYNLCVEETWGFNIQQLRVLTGQQDKVIPLPTLSKRYPLNSVTDFPHVNFPADTIFNPHHTRTSSSKLDLLVPSNCKIGSVSWDNPMPKSVINMHMTSQDGPYSLCLVANWGTNLGGLSKVVNGVTTQIPLPTADHPACTDDVNGKTELLVTAPDAWLYLTMFDYTVISRVST